MGPTVAILLRDPLTDQQVAELEAWIESIGVSTDMRTDVLRSYGDIKSDQGKGSVIDIEISFGVVMDNHVVEVDGQLIECPEVTDILGFNLLIHDPMNWDTDEERGEIISCLGYYPRQRIGVSANSNTTKDYELLEYLTLHLLEMFGGMVDLGGPMHQPPDDHKSYGPETGFMPEYDLEQIRSFVKTFPGRIREMYYAAGRKSPQIAHLMDEEAFRAWLEYPYHYLIK